MMMTTTTSLDICGTWTQTNAWGIREVTQKEKCPTCKVESFITPPPCSPLCCFHISFTFFSFFSLFPIHTLSVSSLFYIIHLMPHQFQPKDARIKSDIDFDDDELTLYSQSSRKTRTQELADFLLSTGPEEFHKNNSVPSSASSSGSSTSGSIATLSFLKKARNKSKGTLASITQQNTKQQSNKSHHGPSSSSVPVDASTSPKTKTTQKTHIEIAPPPPEPILPRRESSLYSGSMRYRSMSSSHGFGTQRTHHPKSHDRHVADVFESRQIDQALQQRITMATANGHLTTTTVANDTTSSSGATRIRHAQIQTDQS